jgi:arylsulfatase A-like enzyme
MWPRQLRKHGYHCEPGGKVMRGYRALPQEIHEAIYSTPYAEIFRKFSTGRRKRNFPKGQIPDHVAYGGHRDGLATMTTDSDNRLYDHQVADSAIEFLTSYDKEAPFYREVGFQSPHGPWTTPRRFKEQYNFKNIRQPKEWKTGFDLGGVPEDLIDPNIDNTRHRFWRQSVRNYFSAVSYADYQIGRVWEALKSSPHAKNTLVVILSDHGFHLGERNWFGKSTLWEQVANVPLILHDPARPRPQVVQDPVALVDIGPTIMDYLGLPPIADSPGRSLLPQLAGEQMPGRVVPTFFHDHAAVRCGKYRFIRYSDGTEQFFDLSRDWWQTKDLGPQHPDYAAVKAAHAACCKTFGLHWQLDDGALEDA